jgi:hypothetical protein
MLLKFLIEAILLKKPSQLPSPKVDKSVEAVHHFHTVGNAYFQAKSEDSSEPES